MDLDTLFAAVDGSNPCGEDLSFSHEFDHIAELRREDDPTLDQGEWVTPLKVADWGGVARLCEQLLRERSKDLRLAMWLTEAWAVQDGYAGLLRGMRLCHGLCERYWDNLHPALDDGDPEQRVGNLRWLLQKTVSLATSLPVTQGRGPHHATYSLRSLQEARHLQQQPPQGQDTVQDTNTGALTPEVFMRALKDTPVHHLQQQLTLLSDLQASVRALQSWIDAKVGDDGPSFVAAKEALAQAHHELHRLMREAGMASEAAQDDHGREALPAHTDQGETPTAPVGRASGPLQSRQQALQQLREVAAYFRRTEPHSPVTYLADKAVRWGDMPLHEWLRQVVKDQGSLSHLEELLGLTRPADEPGQ